MNEKIISWLQHFIDKADSGVRQRGKTVFNNIREDEYQMSSRKISMDVESSNGFDYYSVELKVDIKKEVATGTCDCPFNEQYESTCKHQIAVALLWKTVLSAMQGISGKELKISSNTAVTQLAPVAFDFNLSKLSTWEYTSLINNSIFNGAYRFPCTIEEFEEGRNIVLSLVMQNTKAAVRYAGKNKLQISCNCGKLRNNLFCIHVARLLEEIKNKYGMYYFRKFDDFSAEINATLAEYGLLSGDLLAKEFMFAIDHQGNFMVQQMPKNLLKISNQNQWSFIENIVTPIKSKKLPPDKLLMLPNNYTDAGLLLNMSGKFNIGLWIEGLLFSQKNGKQSVMKHPLKTRDDLIPFSEFPEAVLNSLEKITEESLINFLSAKGHGNIRNFTQPFSQLYGDAPALIMNYCSERLFEMKDFLAGYPNLYKLNHGVKFSRQNITKISFSNYSIQLSFQLLQKNQFIEVQATVTVDKQEFPLTAFTIHHNLFMEKEETLFLINKSDMQVMKWFAEGNVIIHEKEKEALLRRLLIPLSKNYPVAFNNIIKYKTVDAAPAARVYVSELNNDFLLIKPKWQYENIEVEGEISDDNLLEMEGAVYKINRIQEAEKQLWNTLKPMHPLFARQQQDFFYLPFNEALKGNWFLKFYQQMQEHNIPVFGMNNLKKFRYNTNSPKLRMQSSSGMDWFDLKIEVTYGDQVVPLHELKKAIISKQDFILLDDGSLGMLPKEWINQYSMLLKLGHVKENNLKVSKFHWTIIDELHNELNDDALVKELLEKKNRLQNISSYEETPLPASLLSVMRDYQMAGYQWLNQLDHLGWGACLADDMGLGKTLQTLAFLQHVSEKYPEETHLIVCPTSLIYNWETEINKFTPSLTYHVHYGSDREFNEDKYKNFRLIIASYGMVRSDIDHFSAFKFGYVILDESQSIKNPAAQITKAVQLLKARNRIVLSGTPVQNNTFDLFAQMHFLNPGMLGSMEFFKSEFATPIDKYGEKDKVAELRKLTYPFLLRRTKEQVAKDLPDKTETILWCEMDTQQRKIYNSFKEYYRVSILQKIAEDGIAKSGIYILEGLLKLRQICDSPALLNEEEKYPNVSVKMEELIRELQENTGTHKALVFSQFVGMLKLIEKELQARSLTYVYLDGSTPAEKRKDAVNEFQQNANQRIFLISLKAGGVGLNLTAADYVYLIDPWWNPAVEQQAIDRTHRIGQQNKVFAYKMICKDSVEEKIIKLQEKKKALASDLIADETGFVKKLTKEDVEFLFS
ncbi:MAG: DEAD/DEAH box helicase [Chitinophagales bacterium]